MSEGYQNVELFQNTVDSADKKCNTFRGSTKVSVLGFVLTDVSDIFQSSRELLVIGFQVFIPFGWKDVIGWPHSDQSIDAADDLFRVGIKIGE